MNHKMMKMSLLSVGTLVIMIQSAFAKAPVVVEMFGRNECSIDTLSQENILETLHAQDNVIFINCRKHFTDEYADNKFAHKFCNKRADEYKKRIGFNIYPIPLVVVNGRWEANFSDVAPAVNLGALDKVEKVDLTINQGALEIALPPSETKESGTIFVYAYMPTQGKKTVLVDPDLELTAQIKDKIAKGQSVPFVTEVAASSLYLKPVIGRERVGEWHGEMLQISYPLNEIQTMVGLKSDELSYVVVVHRGNDEIGEVIAAGEYTSSAEIKGFYHDRGPKIERRSSPVLWAEDLGQ